MNKRNSKRSAFRVLVALLLVFALTLPLGAQAFAQGPVLDTTKVEDPESNKDVTIQQFTWEQFEALGYAQSKKFSQVDAPRPLLDDGYEYGMTLGELYEPGVDLPAGFYWKNPATVPVAGEYEYEMIFDTTKTTEDDKVNFVGQSTVVKVAVNILKADPLTALGVKDEITVIGYHGETLREIEKRLPEGYLFGGYDLNQVVKNDTVTDVTLNYYNNLYVPEDTANYETVDTITIHVIVKGETKVVKGYVAKDTPVFANPQDRESIGTLGARTPVTGVVYARKDYIDPMTKWDKDGKWVKINFNGQEAYIWLDKITLTENWINGYMLLDDYIYAGHYAEGYGKRIEIDFETNHGKIAQGTRVEGYIVTANNGVDYVEVKLADGTLGYIPVKYVVEDLDKVIATVEKSGYLTADVYARDATTGEVRGVANKGTYISGVVEGKWLIFTQDGIPYKVALAYVSATKPSDVEVIDTPNEEVEKVSGYTTSSIYVRGEKGAKEYIDILDKGTPVNGIVDGAWIRFEHEGQTAYIARQFVAADLPVIGIEGYLSSSVYVRGEKGSSASLGILPAGAYVEGAEEGAWTRINYNGQTAYIATRFIEQGAPTVDGQTTAAIYVRPEKNSNEYLGILAKGSDVVGLEEGAWVRISYNGQTAYVAKAFVK